MNIDELTKAVSGESTAFRVSSRMQPVGGQGTPIYPSTYGTNNARTKYAVEGPKDGNNNEWKTALLQSVAQGAHYLSSALDEQIQDKKIHIPNFGIDFTQVTDKDNKNDLADLGLLTTLGLPHRVYDAILRDSELDKTLFRLSDIGRAITEASPRNATALYQYAPTVLLFGGWDSTGPKGGLGAKFERAIYSEIVAHDLRLTVKVGSRIDPLGIQKTSTQIFQAESPEEDWVIDQNLAFKEKSKAKLKGKDGKPSEINHGNVAPYIDNQAGGIVMDHAVHTCVLSLGVLRKLQFATYPDGTAVPPEKRKEVNNALRTVLAAIGLLAITARMDSDFALRSRCHLINEQPWKLELLSKSENDITTLSLSLDEAIKLLKQAVKNAEKLGIYWHDKPITLRPANKLVELIRVSREKMISEKTSEEGNN